MRFLIEYIHWMPVSMWFGLSMFWCAIYLLFIAPAIFRFWIIPKIENRYGAKLVFDNPLYLYGFFTNWNMPPIEMSFYIFPKYFGWKKWRPNGRYNALAKVNYDTKTASRAEIVVALITYFFFWCAILSVIAFAIAT